MTSTSFAAALRSTEGGSRRACRKLPVAFLNLTAALTPSSTLRQIFRPGIVSPEERPDLESLEKGPSTLRAAADLD